MPSEKKKQTVTPTSSKSASVALGILIALSFLPFFEGLFHIGILAPLIGEWITDPRINFLFIEGSIAVVLLAALKLPAKYPLVLRGALALLLGLVYYKIIVYITVAAAFL